MTKAIRSSRPAARTPNTQRLIRLTHGWLGMLIAPSVLFFALSGGLQVYRLHEAHAGYTPPAALAVMGAFHKDLKPPRPRDPFKGPGRKGGRDRGPPPPDQGPTVVLKWLAVFVSAGLFVSTGLGVWMALQDRLRRRVSLALLAVGTVVPLALALMPAR